MAEEQNETPQTNEAGELRVQWIKKGGGTFHMRFTDAKGKIRRKPIKPEQKFWAFPSEIPEVFRDVIKPLGELPKEVALKSASTFEVKEAAPTASQKRTLAELKEGPETGALPKARYEIMLRSAGWYDVIDHANEKPVNDSALRKGAAGELFDELTAVIDTPADGDTEIPAQPEPDPVDTEKTQSETGRQQDDEGHTTAEDGEHDVVPAEPEGFYNVINTASGKVQNEKPLRKNEADELATSLQ